MTREEEIGLKAGARAIVFRDELILDGVDRKIAEIYSLIAQRKFKEGAEWADETMIEKAISWLEDNVFSPEQLDRNYSDKLRKAMEEK